MRFGLLSRPAVRNALGLHSPSRCAAGAVSAGMRAGLIASGLLADDGAAPPWCGCSCRSCRRFHHNPVPRVEIQPVQGPPTLDEAYDHAGVWHLDDGCETCDERAAAARRGEW